MFFLVPFLGAHFLTFWSIQAPQGWILGPHPGATCGQMAAKILYVGLKGRKTASAGGNFWGPDARAMLETFLGTILVAFWSILGWKLMDLGVILGPFSLHLWWQNYQEPAANFGRFWTDFGWWIWALFWVTFLCTTGGKNVKNQQVTAEVCKQIYLTEDADTKNWS